MSVRLDKSKDSPDLTDYYNLCGIEKIKWSSIKLMNKLPTPQSTMGRITLETKNNFTVYVYDVDKERFDAYVAECRDNGFDRNYTKSQNAYSATNLKGHILKLEYKGSNILCIQITKGV